MINVYNKYKFKGEGIYIGRPSCLGNPFSHLEKTKAEYKVSNRDEAVDLYEEWLRDQLKVKDGEVRKEMFRLYNKWQSDGKLHLICWCSPKRCHGDVIKKLMLERYKKLNHKGEVLNEVSI